MRNLILFSILFIFTFMPVFAKDEIQKNGSLVVGKITTYSDGLINIYVDGREQSYSRAKRNDFYGDYISYREKPILGGTIQENCRIIFIDRFYVTYETQNSKVTLPRYRVSRIVIDAN